MSARWDLIHLLARVDGNDRSGAAADTNILDHLYGKQADAILGAGWIAPRVTDYAEAAHRAGLRSGAGDYVVRKAASNERLGGSR